ncbi:MAG: hypothetical protein DRH03_10580, partial [Deltaproteobacteria bacterium]
PLKEYFFDAKNISRRNWCIIRAINDGYKQSEIASFLNISAVLVSKIIKNHRQKIKLFDRLQQKGVFWSYSKTFIFKEACESLLCEYALKYGDFEDLKTLFSLYGKTRVKNIWEEKLVEDQRFQKFNLFLARVFLGMDLESSYFKRNKSARFEKFRLLAS